MNRIYKVIWSKAKNCYVVASELAKSRTKSPKSSVISPAIVAGVLACVLSFGAVMPAYAGDATKVSQNNSNNIIGADVWQWLHDNGLINENTTVSDVNGYFVFGNNTTVTNSGVGVTEANGFIGIGNGISATPRTGWDGRYASYMLNSLTALPVISHSVAVGDGVTLREEETIGIGYNALSEGYKSISIGSGAISNYERNVTIGAGANSHGHLATALGAEAKANGYRTVAIGYDAQALLADSPTYVAPRDTNSPQRSVAIGSGSRALANMAVAIGDNAVAEQKKAWVVSIGANSYSGLLGASAIGFGSKAYGKNSVAIGRQAFAGEPNSHVDVSEKMNPDGVVSKGDNYGTNALAIGYMAYAPATNSFALGYKAQALGENSFALGSGKQGDTDFDNITKAEGDNSFAIGYLTQVKGIKSGAVGVENKIYGNSVNVFGSNNTVDKGTSGTDTVENVLVLGNKNSASIDNKASASRDSGTPTVSGAIGIGNGVILGEENATAIGNGSKSTALNSFAAGQDAEAAAENTTAIGFGATSSKKNALAFGTGASASETDTVAVGSSASASETNAVAIGSFASATKENSVAIGAGSVADVANTVSVGKAKVMSGETVISPEVTRRLMHVTAGTDDTDAVNVKQLRDMALDKANVDASNVGKSITLPDDYFAPGTTDDEKATATREARLLNQQAWGEALGGLLDAQDKTHIAASDTRLVQGKDVHQHVTPGSDGNYIAVASTTGQNLTALDEALKDSDDSSVKSITANGKVVTYTKGNGTTGTFTTQDTTYTAGHGLILTETEFKAKAGKNTTVDANGIHALDTKVEAGTGMAMETSGDTPDANNVRTYKVGLSTETQNKLDNAMASFKTAVDGGTAQTISKTADTANFINGKNMEMTAGEAGITVATKENVTFTSVTAGTGDSAVAISGSGVQVGGATYISSSGLNANGKTIANVAAGSANTDAVNVSQLKELGDGKANVALDNITAAGHNVIKTDAKSAINVKGNNDVKVTKTDVDGVDTYNLSVAKDGTVVGGDTKLVTGDTVYNAIQGVISDTETALNGKANIALDNITEAGHNVIKADAQSAINVVGDENARVVKKNINGVDIYYVSAEGGGRVAIGDTGLITGNTAYVFLTNETHPGKQGNYITMENSAGKNLTALDTQVKINADTIAVHTTDIANLKNSVVSVDGKANVALDNITADGHNVIKADAKSAINVEGNMDVKVTKTDVNGVDTYSLSVAKDGTVVGGDMKLVTGDTVYNAIQDVISDTETSLNGKANVNLDNINADGVNVVRTVAKNAVKVADGENTTVSSETDTDGNITYKVKTNATGMVTVNNTGLLNGGTVYNEVRPESDGNYITVANTTGQNLTALDAKLKQTYELAIEASTQGHDANAVHYDSVSKEKVTLQGENGTVLTNLKDGEVSATSTDAVTGRQLHEVKQTTIENKQAIDGLTEKVGTTNDGSYVKSTNTVGQNLNTLDSQLKNNSDAISTLRETTNTQLETKTNTDMSNITETGKETIRELARGSVNVVSEDGTVTVTESNVDTVRTFDLSVVKDGKVESGNTGIVTGGTVYDAIQKSSMITLEDNTIRIGAKNNAEIIDITNSNGEGRVLHGIITDPNDNNSAANVGYVNAIGEAVINNVNGGFRRMDEKINKTGAHAAALASLAPASFDGGEKWALSAAVGNYHGETAAAIGAFYRPADNIMINLRSSLGSGNNMVGAGVSFALDKGFSTGISKKQLVNTINVQAEKLQQAEARIAEQDRRAAEQDKKIAELEAIVKELVKERKQ